MRIVLVLCLLLPAVARALPLDEGRHVQLRARLYTEASISTQDSEPQTRTAHATGQLFSHRTFFNPELDADLRPWVPLDLDTIGLRFALWSFYDGIYDYGTSQYDRARDALGARFSEGHTSSAAVTGNDRQRSPYRTFAYQPDPVWGGDAPFRLNEAYVDLAKNGASLRVGRQAISWGESDTIALLDQTNPFDLTRGAPGIFEDVDEARIPLWTIRATLPLVRSLGPITDAFLDTYLVPGSIDTTVAQPPLLRVSPYAPPEDDPQALIDTFRAIIPEDLQSLLFDKKIGLGGLHFVQYDHLPSRSMANSRWGLRLQTVLARDYTASLWFYRTFTQVPVPRFKALDLSRAPAIHPGTHGPSQLITETVHRPVNVFATAVSTYSELLKGVLRAQAMYFLDEAAFIPNENLPFERLVRQPALRRLLAGLGVDLPGGRYAGNVPTADFLRWEIGYDRNFFVRALNPSNGFILVGAFVGSWNLSETFTGKDYRYYGQRKPSKTGLRTGANVNDLPDGFEAVGKLRTVPGDFVDLKPVETFFQTTVQTDYMHGRLSPRLTVIINPRGTYVVAPSVQYRWSDHLLFDLRYVAIEGGFFQTGFFRDRDQVSARATVLLN
jgi:hypothetical protein